MNKCIVIVAILAIANCKIIMTKDKWATDLIILAKSPSEFRTEWPYNALYWDGRKWYCDGVNMIKALFNGRNVRIPRKDPYRFPIFPNIEDVDAGGLIRLCTDISIDFTKLKAGEPRILYLNGHIGAYLGKEIKVSKGVVNVVECTASWEHGALFSYVDSNGNRRYFKGSTNIRGKWERHGKPSKWVQY